MLRRIAFLLVAMAAVVVAADVAFTVSMPAPENHTYHVTLRFGGRTGDLGDFKMPRWSPGYYGIEDYARNVSHFRAEDGAGRALAWEKVAVNTWRVVTAGARTVVLNYDVFALTNFPANSYLDADRGYISPAGLFLYPDGQLRQPATVEIQLPIAWKQIATGLDRAVGRSNAFLAADFDVLYDSPLLLGNHEHLRFDVGGVPHFVAIENVPADIDRAKMLADLKTLVTAATQLMGDIPYRHYTFLLMGRGVGGIEHANSSSDQFDGRSLGTPGGYLRWLSFIAHEYFHNFNVKRIRPLALGPFDYEQENVTDMLWVSEGLSVYYQDLVLVRAGLMTRDQYLEKMAAAIGAFENASGHRYQSATESSRNTWNSMSGVGGDRNTTISYYNNGAMLGALLDLKIREGSGNRKSLDDVMRGLYRKYYLQARRGFTGAEFRAECETAAGADLGPVFEYASTTREVDYARYFALAGLTLDVTMAEAPGGLIGLDTRTEEIAVSELPGGGRAGRREGGPPSRLIVTDCATASPAAVAGLRPGDRILSVNGTVASAVVLNRAIGETTPGETIRLRVWRGGSEFEVAVGVVRNVKRTYRLTVSKDSTSAQKAIRESWLRKAL